MEIKSFGRQVTEEGYVILQDVLQEHEVQRILAASEHVLRQYEDYVDKHKIIKEFTSFRHLNDPRWHQQSHEHLKVLLELAADPRCTGPVELIFGEPCVFREIRLFANPRFRSWEGQWHRDSEFNTTVDEERILIEKMRSKRIIEGIQFQIPLLDNDDIEYVPYSPSRFDSPEEFEIRMASKKKNSQLPHMPNAFRISMKAGDGLIFHPYGIHRGRYHKDRPRRTLMITYTPKSRPLYDRLTSDQKWFISPDYDDSFLSPRARTFFREYIDTYRSEWTKEIEKKPTETSV